MIARASRCQGHRLARLPGRRGPVRHVPRRLAVLRAGRSSAGGTSPSPSGRGADRGPPPSQGKAGQTCHRHRAAGVDGSAANEAAIKNYNEEHGTTIVIRQGNYLNNIVAQDHHAVKRITRSILEFKSFDAAQGTLAGVELMHMIKERQLMVEAGDEGLTAAEQFYALAA